SSRPEAAPSSRRCGVGGSGHRKNGSRRGRRDRRRPHRRRLHARESARARSSRHGGTPMGKVLRVVSRRSINAVVTIFGIIWLSYVLIPLMPGDANLALAPRNTQV